jgi:hypothetical protein
LVRSSHSGSSDEKAALLLGVILIPSIAVVVYGSTREVALCVVAEGQERYEAPAEFLSGVLDLTLALSTSLVSLGAALLIGLHSNVRLTPAGATCLFVALVALAQSAGYGVWWKLHLANLWFNECYNQIASPHVQWVYQAHFALLIFGIVSIALLVGFLSLSQLAGTPKGEGDA